MYLKKFLLLVILCNMIFELSSCDSVIVGKSCNFDTNSLIQENESYIVNGNIIYNKNTKTFVHPKDLNQHYYSVYKPENITLDQSKYTVTYIFQKQLICDVFSYEGGLIFSNLINDDVEMNDEESLILNGFYSSYNRIDYDKMTLTSDEKILWDYAKSKSIKNSYPYYIEGYFKETKTDIYFNVNVYDKIMWKGSALINQGVYCSSLNKFNKTTKQIEEILYLDKKAIKLFNENYLYYFSKANQSIYFYDLQIAKEYKICKNKENCVYYGTNNYLIEHNRDNVKKSEIYYINKKN